jgi:hypothetical protein
LCKHNIEAVHDLRKKFSTSLMSNWEFYKPPFVVIYFVLSSLFLLSINLFHKLWDDYSPRDKYSSFSFFWKIKTSPLLVHDIIRSFRLDALSIIWRSIKSLVMNTIKNDPLFKRHHFMFFVVLKILKKTHLNKSSHVFSLCFIQMYFFFCEHKTIKLFIWFFVKPFSLVFLYLITIDNKKIQLNNK